MTLQYTTKCMEAINVNKLNSYIFSFDQKLRTQFKYVLTWVKYYEKSEIPPTVLSHNCHSVTKHI